MTISNLYFISPSPLSWVINSIQTTFFPQNIYNQKVEQKPTYT